MMSINHPEKYYQEALESQGIDWTKLTHKEVSVFKAPIKAIEADVMIEIAESLPKTTFSQKEIEAVCAK